MLTGKGSQEGGGAVVLPINSELFREAPPERGPFLRL